MNRKILKIVSVILLVIIAFFCIYKYLSNRSLKTVENPYEYNIDEFKRVNEELITYKETKQINLQLEAIGLAYSKGELYILTNSFLKIINTNGREKKRIAFADKPLSVSVDIDEKIYIGFKNYIVAYSQQGVELKRSIVKSDSAKFTSIAISDKNIFVADAGLKQVLVFDKELNRVHAFKGESGVSDFHGIILPSAHFSLAVNNEQELWIINPGLHTIQNYSVEGRLRGHWSAPSFDIDGFSGCCNPYYLSFLSDGNIVTSEKGLVRIKIHKPSGELLAVVAAPDKFINGHKAPAIAVDENDNIFILDFDRKMIRYFEQK